MNVLTNPRDVDIYRLITNTIAGNVYYSNTVIGANSDLSSRLDPIPDASFARDKTKSPPDSECLQGTREGVIKAITRWAGKRISPRSSHVYWLYGYAGCGKSSISQAVAEQFHNKGRLAASFFFFRSSDRRNRFNSVPATAPLILAALQADFGLLSKPVGTQMELLVYKPLEAAIERGLLGPGTTAAVKGPFLITIDGLDECEDKKDVEQFIGHMLAYFRRNSKLPLRFFIASRVEEHIRSHLTTTQVCLDNLDDRSPDKDIAAFIRARFARAAEEDRIVRAYGPSWPKSADIDSLAKLGKGSFIFISMLLKYIFETVDDGLTPMQRLPRALEMRSNLDGLYASILSRSEHFPHFSSIISTLTYLQEPLPTSSIAELLNIELYEVIAVLVNLQAIIQLPGDDITPITLCHSSLHDFLTTQSRSGPFFSHLINHETISYRCLDLLIRHRPTWSTIIRLGKQSGQGYAYYNVGTHLELASKARNYDRHYYIGVVRYMNQQFPIFFPLVLSTYLVMRELGGLIDLSKPLVDLLMPKAPAFELELIVQVLTTLSKQPNALDIFEGCWTHSKWSYAPDATHYTFLAKQCVRFLVNPGYFWVFEHRSSTFEYVLCYWAKHIWLAISHDPTMDLNVLQEYFVLSRENGPALPRGIVKTSAVVQLNIQQMQKNVALAVEMVQNKFPGLMISNPHLMATSTRDYEQDHVVQVDGGVSALTLLAAFQHVNPAQSTRLTFLGEGVVLDITVHSSGDTTYSRTYSTPLQSKTTVMSITRTKLLC